MYWNKFFPVEYRQAKPQTHCRKIPTHYNDVGDELHHHSDVKYLRRQHYCDVYDYIWQHDLIKLTSIKFVSEIDEGAFRAYSL